MLTHALKEWAVAVDALADGKTIMLLRKGGIREASGRFRIEQQQVWLYPTVEHQKPELLKPEYATRVAPVPSGWHPQQVTIQAWADITHVFQVNGAKAIAAVSPFHVWNDRFVSDRLKWKPAQPLYVLLLRVYRLDHPHDIPHRSEYGGCRSWIELTNDWEAIATTPFSPCLTDAVYDKQVATIRSVLGKR